MVRVGLTGGIAMGKSTVSEFLRSHGAVVIDADAIAREVVEPGTPGFAQVVEEFGEEILNQDGAIDRPKLASIVFSDEAARKRLEGIVHPLVFLRIVELEEQAPKDAVVVHDLPLLAEGGRTDGFDAVVVVDAPVEEQIERMVRDRGWTEDEARARIAAQASREARRAIATHLIENTGTREDLAARVGEVFDDLVRSGS
ncbi:MAG: dephospho-CoA kinase [Marmoricola sp.]